MIEYFLMPIGTIINVLNARLHPDVCAITNEWKYSIID